MTLNIEQAAIVEAMASTVNVVAGAGTGKTYTLTERIVGCVKRMIEEKPEIELPIEHILAITFTDKAAGELKSRVRAALFREASESGSEKMLLCALNADNAWVSTIHGMASRILHENAIDFGLDPAFGVISNSESGMLFERALEQAISSAKDEGDPLMAELFETEAIYPIGFNGDAITKDIEALFARTSFMPKGLDGVVTVLPKDTPATLLNRMVEAANAVLPILEGEGWTAKGKQNACEIADGMKDAIAGVHVWIDENRDIGFLDTFDIGEYLDTLHAFPPTTNAFPRSPEQFKEPFSEYRRTYQNVSMEALTSLGVRRAQAILRLARYVHKELVALKAEGASHLDNNDLLLRCAFELGKPDNEGILRSYRDQFEYIMIDEFQDTDRLQMDIVSMVSRNEGDCGLSNVCTVGDMQQSIYRFRGADVTLASSRKSALENTPFQFSLTGNYRSHEAVLSVVEKVFSQEDVFGKGFLRLEAKRCADDARMEAILEEKPRILIDFVDKDSDSGLSSDQARMSVYQGIAQTFRELADKGESPSSMAVLLGRMANAAQVQAALMSVGLESVVTGGSVFGATYEAHLIASCLDYAVNQSDDMALFALLTSPMFSISDSAFLSLTEGCSDRGSTRSSLSKGFSNLDLSSMTQLSEDDVFELDLAHRLLFDFTERARCGDVVCALRDLLQASGLFYRAQLRIRSKDVSALASAANISKALGIVASMEEDSTGIADLARRFRLHIETEKEAPGVLKADGSEFVSIMTVHASKGLEFDHVAVADVKDGISSAGGFVCENIGDTTYLAARPVLGAIASKDCIDIVNKVRRFTFDEDFEGEDCAQSVVSANTPGESYRNLSAYKSKEELEEARRLMYVAMTRARETLRVGYYSGRQVAESYPGIYGDIHEAMRKNFGNPDSFEAGFYAVESGIGFQRRLAETEGLKTENLEADADGSLALGNVESDDLGILSAVTDFAIPLYPVRPSVCFSRANLDREGMYSYSSLSSALKEPYDVDIESKDEDSLNVAKGYCLSNEGYNPSLQCQTTLHNRSERLCLSSDDTTLRNNIANRQLSEDEYITGDADKATDLGTAFHRLAQLAIINAATSGAEKLSCPDEGRLRAQITSCNLTQDQTSRLVGALDLWFSSDIASKFVQFGAISAEVPFTVYINPDGFFLEGEIDGLSDNGKGEAFLIDYKTGGSRDETAENLHDKHLFQAQCYAYALLNGGFNKVYANFVRVEQHASDDPSQPQIVKYSFGSEDIEGLRDAISSAWRYSID